MNLVADTARADAARPVACRWRDVVGLAGGLLSPLDIASLLFAGYLSTSIYVAWLAPAGVDPGAWGTREGTALFAAAVLASVSLYDRRFGTRASRGQTAALVRRYLLGFLGFAAAALVLAFTSRALDSLPHAWIAIWFAASLLLTSLARVLLARRVRLLERSGVLTEVIAVVGAGALADRLIRHLRQTRRGRIEILGVFDDAPTAPADSTNTPTGTVAELIELGKTRPIDWILLTLPCTAEGPLLSIVQRLKALAVPIGLCPQNVGLELPCRTIDYVGDGVPVTLLADRPIRRWNAVVTSMEVFLPRWLVTVAQAPRAVMRALMLRLSRGGAARHLPKAQPLAATVCAFDDFDTAAFAEVASRFEQDRYGYVVTPNADHLIRLHEDASFRALYAAAAYVLLDSRFLARILRITRGIRLPVCTGSDLTAKLFGEVISPDDPLVLIGGTQAQARQLIERYGLRRLSHLNPPMGFIRDADAVQACLRFVEAHSPFRFCLLALGSPQQEMVAQQLQARGVARGLALCVGASIDFLTGDEQRAPRWLQRCGCEWLFRLVQSPGRLAKRYLVRGPRVFGLLRRTEIVLRPASHRAVRPAAPAAITVRPLGSSMPLYRPAVVAHARRHVERDRHAVSATS